MSWGGFYRKYLSMKNSIVHYNSFTQGARQKYVDIFSDVDKFFGWLAGVMKYVSYRDKKVNKTLFPDKNSKWSALKQVTYRHIENVQVFNEFHLKRIADAIKDIKRENLLNESQKHFLLHKAFHIQLALAMMQYAVYIEAEKWWYPLDQSKKQDCLTHIEAYETELYGPRVSDVPEEVSAVVHSLSNLYQSNKTNLSQGESNLFFSMLQHFFSWPSDLIAANTIHQNDETVYSSDVFAPILQKILTIYGKKSIIVYQKKDIQSIYQENDVFYMSPWTHWVDKKHYFESLGLKDSFKIYLSDSASNVSVWRDKNLKDHSITFPLSATYSFRRICELIDHEIGTHVIRSYNDENGLDVKSGMYEKTEEWIAMWINEKLVATNFDDLSAWEPTTHHISTFIAENYDAEETKKLLTIYYKLLWKSDAQALKEATSRTERIKRYHANDLPGANRKDTVYWRGMKTVVEYLKNVDIETLQHDADLIYRGKFADSDLADIDGLFDGLKVDTSKRISPLALWKILYERYQGNMITKEALQEKDKRFELSMKDLNFTQKRQLLEILQLLD